MANSYTFQIFDPQDLVSASIEASLGNCAQYVIGLIGRYIAWQGVLDFVIEIRPAQDLTWSDADGLLPSVIQPVWNGSQWINGTLAECLTGIDPDPGRADAGCTIYLGEDGTIRNYGSPVWLDPNPVFGIDPAVPAGMHDFVGILTHEIFHSLGFVSFTKEWTDRLSTQGGISYFTGANASALFGGPIPFQSGSDHYGYTQDPSIPISRGLMFQWGNYERNRLDIGRIDLAILDDLGHSIKTYDGLPLFELIDSAANLTGGAGADRLYGDYHANAISGGDGDDQIEGGAGNDSLQGGPGDDYMRGGAGVDGFDGGADSGGAGSLGLIGDRISFFEDRATQAVIADLRTNTISNDGFGNAETMTGIESLGGDTAFADTFYGNDHRNGLLIGRGDLAFGFGGDDFFEARLAPGVIDGGAGTDALRVRADGGLLLPDADGDGIAEVAPAMTAGWLVDLAAGTLRDGFGNVGTVTGIENVTGTELNDELRGDGWHNRLDGGGGNDVLLAGAAGTDALIGGDGADLLYFGADLSGGDTADGGAGRDVMVLQGNYVAGLASVNIVNIESISLQSGARTTWGDTANNFYDYNLTMANSNVPAGFQLIVNAQSLRVGEDFTFDGSAETDGGMFLVYGGHGVDTLKGGAGNDVFFFEGARFQPGDSVDGGAGRDAIVISSGSGVNRFEFSDTSFTGIESISLNNRFTSDPSQKPSYELVLANGNVAPGATLIVNGSSLSDPTQTVSVDGSDVHDGKLILFSGAGGDTLIGGDGADLFYGAGGRDHLTGGGGADTFQYRSTSDSMVGDPDQILDFETGVDKIDLHLIDSNTLADGDQSFSWIGSSAFGGTGASSAGQLRAYQSGGDWFVEGDTNGDGNADLVITMTVQSGAALGTADFLL
jgi:Ca2+-binding RTX toxin-like protein